MLLVGDEMPSLNQAHVTEHRAMIQSNMLNTEIAILCVNAFSVSFSCFELNSIFSSLSNYDLLSARVEIL